jgi:hypothetical protein
MVSTASNDVVAQNGKYSLAARIVENVSDIKLAVNIDASEVTGPAVCGCLNHSIAVNIGGTSNLNAAANCVKATADIVRCGVEEVMSVGSRPVNLVHGVGPVAASLGQAGQQQVGSKYLPPGFDRVAMEVVGARAHLTRLVVDDVRPAD